MKQLFLNLSTIGAKALSIYKAGNIFAIIAALWTFIISGLGDATNLILAITIVCAVDLITGWRASSQGFRSKLAKRKARDLYVYFCILVFPFIIDKCLKLEDLWTSRIITALIVGIEAWSVLGNLARTYPNIGAIPMIKKYLAKEIADKMSIDKEELENELNNTNNGTDKQVPTDL